MKGQVISPQPIRRKVDGHCRFCGRVERLDEFGMIQNHTVRVPWGNRTRVCRGSGKSPE